jgi:hypothetical protein
MFASWLWKGDKIGDQKGENIDASTIIPFLFRRISMKAGTTVLFVGALLSMGCATAINGKYQEIGITSFPTSANVRIDDKPEASPIKTENPVALAGSAGNDAGSLSVNTPYVAMLSRRQPHTITIEMPGYKPYTAVLKRKYNWVTMLNFLTPMQFLGFGWDVVSGAVYKLVPGQVNAVLIKEEP